MARTQQKLTEVLSPGEMVPGEKVKSVLSHATLMLTS